MTTLEVKECTPKMKLHHFSEEILTARINFQVIQLTDSLFVWIGNETNSFNDLSIAMQLSTKEISTTRLLGSVHSQTASDALARRVTAKLNKPVYLSYNLPVDDILLMKAVEKRLHAEINSKPDSF